MTAIEIEAEARQVLAQAVAIVAAGLLFAAGLEQHATGFGERAANLLMASVCNYIGVASAVGSAAMKDREFDEERTRHLAAMETRSRERLAKASDLISRFTALAATMGVSLDSTSFEYFHTTGVVAKAPGIARTLLGPIATQRDGLLPFDEIARRFPPSARHSGCFAGPDFALMAHPCYRRGMHPKNNWAPRFIDLFWQFSAQGADKYIAIDEDRVRIDVDGPTYVEADTWFGAPFDEDIRRIKPGIVKLRPPLDLESFHVSCLFADVYSLDMKWSELDDIKSFQALEMKTEDVRLEVNGQLYFPARYLHAEFEISSNRFRHFDGAVQLFTEEEYLQRRDSDFNMTMKNSAQIKARSNKVFKINGPLDTKDWVEFCCHFYAANPLTFEYFGGRYPTHVVDALARIRDHASRRASEA